jgi:FixJ family two-component response regulator
MWGLRAGGRLILGDEVETTTDPENFKKIQRSFAPGAVAIDLVTPRVEGIKLVRFLADEQSRAQIVIMRGSAGRLSRRCSALARRAV